VSGPGSKGRYFENFCQPLLRPPSAVTPYPIPTISLRLKEKGTGYFFYPQRCGEKGTGYFIYPLRCGGKGHTLFWCRATVGKGEKVACPLFSKERKSSLSPFSRPYPLGPERFVLPPDHVVVGRTYGRMVPAAPQNLAGRRGALGVNITAFILMRAWYDRGGVADGINLSWNSMEYL
jgi:hypothetical protein